MSGLSILLPIFNRDVTTLVRQLAAQVAAWPGPVEILCFDDGSGAATRAANRGLATWPGVAYRELPANVGRAAIRNQLAAAAQYPWLLLLDNNISLPDSQFLARYAAARHQAPVVVGGSCYAAVPPAQPQQLRWHYGRRREGRPAACRQQHPYARFNLKNVLMRTEVFRQIGLDEHLRRYGHEDTKLGWALQTKGVPVLHLDNPVVHDGLEPAAEFLRKSRQAVINLAQLYLAEGLGTETRLLRAALRLRRLGLHDAYCRSFALVQRQVRRRLLTAPTGSLRPFDALKLYWLLLALAQPISQPGPTQTASPNWTGGSIQPNVSVS